MIGVVFASWNEGANSKSLSPPPCIERGQVCVINGPIPCCMYNHQQYQCVSMGGAAPRCINANGTDTNETPSNPVIDVVRPCQTVGNPCRYLSPRQSDCCAGLYCAVSPHGHRTCRNGG